MEHLPQFPESYWLSSVELSRFPKLRENIEVDVAIVGGGITGITSAYVLAKEGYQVALIDAGQLFHGTTGHTTAKITAQHGLIYDELIAHFGEEQARLYYEAQTEAKQFIEQTVKELNIDCSLQKEDAYIFTQEPSSVEKIEKEALAYEKLGIEGGITQTIDLPLNIKTAIVMKNQAQFHPPLYLKKLVAEIEAMGGQIFEETVAVDIVEGRKPEVVMRDGLRVISEHVICATHFPFYDGLGQGAFFTRMYPERAYVLAVKTEASFPGGMYLSAENPSRSLRQVALGEEKYVLVAGENHKIGKGEPAISHYEVLAEFGKEALGIKEIAYRWSVQDLTTVDKVPYIGRLTDKKGNIFVATGFRKWGMTNSTVSALLIKDLIAAKENRFEPLFRPSRFVADPSLKTFIQQNADVAKHFIRGKLDIVPTTIEKLANDDAGIVLVNGKRAGAYKDKEGNIHIVETKCQHLGCEVEWNSLESTWDCPCHGSRYGIDGEVYEGPAKKALKRVENK